ncbi:MAG TPA: ATP-binding protein, partial [Gemmatimonadaceae bacterium]|nr:ATP-binding protein [Gemmatimonadaceae bacterium]
DGSWEVHYWAPRTTPVLGADGAVRYLLHQTEDVTEHALEHEATAAAERRAAELWAVLESMSDAVYIGTAEGITLANQQALDQLGFATREELDRHIGTLAEEIQTRDAETGEWIPAERQAFARALAGERVVQDVRVRHRTTGEDRVVRCTAAPVVVDGRVIAAVAVNADVTDVRRVLAEREQLLVAERAARADAEAARLAAERARREADEANQAKSSFLATMSHEIRTPINAIVGYAQLIELGVAGPVTEQQRSYLARLAATSDHLRGLVDDVLDLAKIDAAGMAVVREFGRTGALVASALDLVRPQASARGIRLVDGRPGDLGEPFVGDEHRVRQILANLLSNAVKFTEVDGTVTITCGTQHATPPAAALRGGGPWTFVRVKDSGIGIAPAEQARVFEPFHQVEGGHTRQQGGTGLGLAISRRLARLMGGDVTLESTPGHGATFTLWLPAAQAGDPEREGESAIARGARARQEPGEARVYGLAEIGTHLRERIEDVIAAYAARMRADPALPGAAHLRRSELEDHQLSFLADVAQTLVVIEEAGGPDPDLLRDGSTIQRIVAELHGALRQRHGWTEAQLTLEYTILGEEIASVVRRRVQEGLGDVSLALEVLGRLVERAHAIGLAALRRAAESERAVQG